jgi:hypothetical protein
MRVTAARQLTFFNGRHRVLRSMRRIVLHLNCTNAWKKLINCGDVFEIVAGAIVWNDALKIFFQISNSSATGKG